MPANIRKPPYADNGNFPPWLQESQVHDEKVGLVRQACNQTAAMSTPMLSMPHAKMKRELAQLTLLAMPQSRARAPLGVTNSVMPGSVGRTRVAS